MHHPYPTITSKKVNLVEVRIRMLSACAQCFLKAGLPSRSAMTSHARGKRFTQSTCLGILLAVLSYSGQADGMRAERYAWKNVQWGGGGFVTGIVAHPSEPNLLYIRTDVGGCYRWDAAGERWIPLLDWLPHSMQNLYGGESIAIDPSNPRNVYFAGGMFDWWRGGPWDVLKSTNQGKTWERTNPTGPRRLGERWTPGVLAPTGHHKPRPTGLQQIGLWQLHDCT